MSVTPKASWPWVKTLLHSVYDQPDKDAVHEQFDHWLGGCPAARLLLEVAADPELITHDHLDRVAHVQAAHYLRGLLVHTGVLPGRDEALDRIGP